MCIDLAPVYLDLGVQAAITKLITDHPQSTHLGAGFKAWIGLTDKSQEQAYGWTDGTPYNFQKWGE